MATNVTTDSITFFNNQLEIVEKNLIECLARIEKYNTTTIPEKKIKIEEMNKKKLEKGKTLLEFNLSPIDPKTNSEVLGLKKRIEAYKFVILLIQDKNCNFDREFSIDDYIKFFETKEKTSTVRLACAKTRLDRNKKKLAENKIKNPKKYGSRPDFPEVNMEIINEQRKLNHWQKGLKYLRSKQLTTNGIKFQNIHIRSRNNIK